MNQTHAERHAILVLAAIRAEADADRMSDAAFRTYCQTVTQSLDLPKPRFTVIPGGEAA